MNTYTEDEQAIQATKNWLEQFVILHNLCPFAAKPFRKKQIRYVSYPGHAEEELAEKLVDEILLLRDANPEELETSIVIAPHILANFLDYNQFLNVVDSIIDDLDVEGIIQVASFHPDYQFADLDRDDVRNYTNRSPYPMFHLIREDSVEKARGLMDVDAIPERNMELLQALGLDKVKKKWQ